MYKKGMESCRKTRNFSLAINWTGHLTPHRDSLSRIRQTCQNVKCYVTVVCSYKQGEPKHNVSSGCTISKGQIMERPGNWCFAVHPEGSICRPAEASSSRLRAQHIINHIGHRVTACRQRVLRTSRDPWDIAEQIDQKNQKL